MVQAVTRLLIALAAVLNGVPTTTAAEVSSVNNATPLFNDLPATVRVTENSPMGTVLTTVTASSRGSGRLTYSIVEGNVNSALSINKTSGTIWVSGLIDYEVASSMSLRLQARVEGSQSLSAFKNLTVIVEDVNDNPPRFNVSLYKASLFENSPIGSSVLQVQASDADDGQNKQINYRLIDGDLNHAFDINPYSGVISAQSSLDREVVNFYRLLVMAADQGIPELTSTAIVEVRILDDNDNPPYFPAGLFSVAIPEELPLHSLILTLTSTDSDTPINANATYTLIPSTDSAFFAVDPHSGNITNIKRLDAERQERYRPAVKVSDGIFTSQTQVTIRLLDVNDNVPTFVRSTFLFDLREGRPGVVGRVIAVDADLSAPNNDFYFSLKRPSTLFELNATSGEITALRSLEYHSTLDGPSATNTHTLEVPVTDLGMPSLSSSATVFISVVNATLTDEATSPVISSSVVPAVSTTVPLTTPTTTTTSESSTFKRTVILLNWHREDENRYIFFRGGNYTDSASDCELEPQQNPCLIPIKARDEGSASYLAAYNAWRSGDLYLDWYGPERRQGTFQGRKAEGSPGIWTSNLPDHKGYNVFNRFGEHYWLLDVDMDCNKTDGGWFEFRGFSPNSGWERGIVKHECWGQAARGAPTYHERTPNHVARCGYVNVFHQGGPCEIRSFEEHHVSESNNFPPVVG